MFRKLFLSLFAVTFALVATSAYAAFHLRKERNAMLEQVIAVTKMAVTSGKLSPAAAGEIRSIATKLRKHEGNTTRSDLKKLERIKYLFASANVRSVLLDQSTVYITALMKKLTRMYAHVLSGRHKGQWE